MGKIEACMQQTCKKLIWTGGSVWYEDIYFKNIVQHFTGKLWLINQQKGHLFTNQFRDKAGDGILFDVLILYCTTIIDSFGSLKWVQLQKNRCWTWLNIQLYTSDGSLSSSTANWDRDHIMQPRPPPPPLSWILYRINMDGLKGNTLCMSSRKFLCWYWMIM